MIAHVDVDRAAAPCFVLVDELAPAIVGDWHSHARHQLLYARRGLLDVETRAARWQLPPQRAAWIPAGVDHRVRTGRAATLATVYFTTASVRPIAAAVCAFPLPPVGRAMILHAAGWGIAVDTGDDVVVDPAACFCLLADLCAGWARHARPWFLPTAASPELGRAMDLILSDLGAPLVADAVAKAAGLSTRSLTRRFRDEAATTFARFLRSARILRAIDLLDEGHRTITEVALAVGFQSPAAFSRAFSELVGESPSAFRRGDAAEPDP